MKRGGWLKRKTGLTRKGNGEAAQLKEEIQSLVRDIVIARDGGCILRVLMDPQCNGYRQDGELILQADHLITRANSATFDDTRLIVCVCKGHHGWKRWHEREYNALVKDLLPPDRVKLWERAEQDSWRPAHHVSADWRISIAALKQELASYGEVLG